jgi:hypothetical protein
MSTEQMKAVHTPANTNALNAPTLNTLGMPTACKIDPPTNLRTTFLR